MRTIVFAATKGGVGKTTLAFNIACEAAKEGTVFVADMDPQKSLQTFIEIRDRDNPMLLTNVHSVGKAISDLERNGMLRDYLIVDAPGSFMEVIEDSIRAANCIIMPMQPSPIDILAQEDVLESARGAGKLDVILAVLNRVDGRTAISDAVKRVGRMFLHQHVTVKNRIAYARSLVEGRAAGELDGEAAQEIRDLWTAIKGTLDTGDIGSV